MKKRIVIPVIVLIIFFLPTIYSINTSKKLNASLGTTFENISKLSSLCNKQYPNANNEELMIFTREFTFPSPQLILDNAYTDWLKNQSRSSDIPNFFKLNYPLLKTQDLYEIPTILYGKPDIPIYMTKIKIPHNYDYVSHKRQIISEEHLDINGFIVPTKKQVPISISGVSYVLPQFEYVLNELGNIQKKITDADKELFGISKDPYECPNSYFSKNSNELIIFFKLAHVNKKKIISMKNIKIYITIKHNILKTLDITDNNEKYDMCVISNKELIGTQDDRLDDFADYAKLRSDNGIKTKCFDITEILVKYSSEGLNMQDKLKKFISNQLTQNSIKFVLLGGDSSIIPPSYIKCSVDDYSAEIPSDAFYTSFDGEWNKGSQLDASLLIPKIYIGRLPASNTNELSSYLKKTRDYLETPYNDKLHKSILLFANKLQDDPLILGADFLQYDLNSISLKNPEITLLCDKISNLNNTKYLYKNTYYFNKTDEIIESFKMANPHLVLDASHGTPTCISNNLLCFNDLTNLKNSQSFVMSSIACMSNQFAKSVINHKGKETVYNSQNDYFSKSILFREKIGALAYAGNSSFGWFNGNPISSQSNLYQRNFAQQLFINRSIGEAFWESKIESYFSLNGDKYSWWIFNGYNLLGDPSLTFKTESEDENIISKITISPTGLAMNIGETRIITATAFDRNGNIIPNAKLDWIVSHPENLELVENGSFRAIKAGSCYIAAHSRDVVSQTIEIKINRLQVDIDRIVIVPEYALVGIGKAYQFKAIALDKNNNEIENIPFKWSLSNYGVGSITQNGLFKAYDIEYPTIVFAKYGNISGQAFIDISK